MDFLLLVGPLVPSGVLYMSLNLVPNPQKAQGHNAPCFLPEVGTTQIVYLIANETAQNPAGIPRLIILFLLPGLEESLYN